jgi:hypothetical protein
MCQPKYEAVGSLDYLVIALVSGNLRNVTDVATDVATGEIVPQPEEQWAAERVMITDERVVEELPAPVK